MGSVNYLKGFLNDLKAEYSEETPKTDVYQKIFKELNQEERKLLLDIIHRPNAKESPRKLALVTKIKTLKEQPFESQRSTGVIKSFNRIMRNIFDDRKSTTEIFKEIIKAPEFILQTPIKAPEPILYKRGEGKNLVSDKYLGKGVTSNKVYEHVDNPKLAVKATGLHEYEIGANLEHPNLAKTHHLYMSDEAAQERFPRGNMVMDKIEGKTINKYYINKEPISKEQTIKALSQARDCCGYLFDQDVYWCDVNDGNIFIEEKTGDLKIIDFGGWNREDDPKNKGLYLLLGAMEVSGWLLKISEARGDYRGLFPKKLFGKELNLGQIVTARDAPLYSDPLKKGEKIEKAFMKKTEKMDDHEIKEFLMNYFDLVIAELEKG